MALGGFEGAIGAGLQEHLEGGSDHDVAAATIQEGILNLIPLYAIGQAVVAMVGLVGEWTGKTVQVPVLGFLVAPGTTVAGAKAAINLVRKASTQYAMGLERYTGNAPPFLWSPSAELKWADDWIADVMQRLEDAWNRGGSSELIAELKTSAITQQAFAAAKALYQWAQDSIDTEEQWLARMDALKTKIQLPAWTGQVNAQPAPHGFKFYAVQPFPQNEVGVLNGKWGTNPTYFKGGEREPLKGKFQLFKRLGLPSYQEYADGIAEAAPPPAQPVYEVFPGASAQTIEAGQVLEDAGPDATQGQVSSQKVGAAANAKAKRERELLVGGAVLLGGVALLALL